MINLKKLYDEHPGCFESSAKFKAYLIDLYPEEKKARINVLVTLLSEGVLMPAQTEDKFDDTAFCKRICDDYGYDGNLVKECFELFAEIFDENTIIDFSSDFNVHDTTKSIEDEAHLGLKDIVQKYDRLVVFDTETSGLEAGRDEIIEFGAVVFTVDGKGKLFAERHGFYIRHNQKLSEQIIGFTGITDGILREKGLERQEAECKIIEILYQAKGVICAYNTQFDLCFVNALLKKQGKTNLLNTCCYLDAMTVYKDRAVYPHKLANAMQTYGVVQARMHDASDDAMAAASVLCKMIEEKDDIQRYLNLFGYNPKYGVNGERLNVIYYAVQPFASRQPLYELDGNELKAQEKVKECLNTSRIVFSELEHLLSEIKALSRIVILKRELAFLDLYSKQHSEDDTKDYLTYTEERSILQKIKEAEVFTKEAKKQGAFFDESKFQKIYRDMQDIAVRYQGS